MPLQCVGLPVVQAETNRVGRLLGSRRCYGAAGCLHMLLGRQTSACSAFTYPKWGNPGTVRCPLVIQLDVF